MKLYTKLDKDGYQVTMSIEFTDEHCDSGFYLVSVGSDNNTFKFDLDGLRRATALFDELSAYQ